MAERRTKVPLEITRRLKEEAGNKCANPGCGNWRTHLHHISQWHVYHTHNAETMVAVCPACHDHIHHGEIPLSDETLLEWKRIVRSAAQSPQHLFVEPADHLEMVLGTAWVDCTYGEAVIDLSSGNHLRATVIDGDMLQASIKIRGTEGTELLRVVNNFVRVASDPDVEYQRLPGRAIIKAPISEKYLPQHVVRQMRLGHPDYGLDGRVTFLDVEVIRPGVIKVDGIWTSQEGTIVVHRGAMVLCSPGARGCVAIQCQDPKGKFVVRGPVTSLLQILNGGLAAERQRRR